ncbi:MAG: metallophosphoesterase family protein [Nitrosotalea sp.]
MTVDLHQPRIDIDNFSSLLDAVIRTLQRERWSGIINGGRINLGLTELKIPNHLVVVGDLHGDLYSLNRILEEINYKKFLSNVNNKLIFLGDYVDRGSHSIEVLYKISHLKQSFPDSVILMRGNHEAPEEFPFVSHDLPMKIAQSFGELKNTIHKKILELFQLFTLTVIIEGKILLVHGGLPVIINTEYRELISRASAQNHSQNDILEDLLWNDPRPIDGWEVSRRRFGKHFGKSISRKWLELTNTCAVVRGHEPCHGFKVDHENMVVTIFSCKESYPDFEGGYLYITSSQLQDISNAEDLVQHIRKIKG